MGYNGQGYNSAPNIIRFFNAKLISVTHYTPYLQMWYSYDTLVAFKYEDTLYAHDKSYSRATSKHINFIINDRSDDKRLNLEDKEFNELWEKTYRKFKYGGRRDYWTEKHKEQIRKETVDELTLEIDSHFTKEVLDRMREELANEISDSLRKALKPYVEAELKNQLLQEHRDRQAELATLELKQYYDSLKRNDIIMNQGKRRVTLDPQTKAKLEC